ncbi:hypothetical protein LOTGIDRAFT_158721 [Lottia gigantea]|uniref:Uncharacterized protein n=1 Tax=Lottia gigantea TaxID=225164 RepID=V4AUX3_LOTGI|nr:hypothetical protein LOTGIDRAFT_158721 [Lottia gigantea]ESO98775.1 hypothetical protein LOTGIDRAFT_158721 [Lottia gigantea]
MIVGNAPKTYFGSGDIQKSLGSLPGFPWAKYPGEKHLPGHNYTGPCTRDKVETKEYEINDENSKVNHLHESKTSGKCIDRFRMLIIPDNENKDQLGLRDFYMKLETESPPSVSIIRNPELQKGGNMSYQFLRATDFEYVKLYFVNNDIFTSIDIHKSQEKQNFLILTIRDYAAYVNISISIEKLKFSLHLNKINDSKQQISLVTVKVVIDDSKHVAALSEVHLI